MKDRPAKKRPTNFIKSSGFVSVMNVGIISQFWGILLANLMGGGRNGLTPVSSGPATCLPVELRTSTLSIEKKKLKSHPFGC